MSDTAQSTLLDPWQLHRMAVDEVQLRFQRITAALSEASVPHAVVGGQVVAAWVATKDPDAVRVTKDVDILLSRDDLPRARAAALSLGLEYCKIQGVGMFVERQDPHPRRGPSALGGRKLLCVVAWRLTPWETHHFSGDSLHARYRAFALIAPAPPPGGNRGDRKHPC